MNECIPLPSRLSMLSEFSPLQILRKSSPEIRGRIRRVGSREMLTEASPPFMSTFLPDPAKVSSYHAPRWLSFLKNTIHHLPDITLVSTVACIHFLILCRDSKLCSEDDKLTQTNTTLPLTEPAFMQKNGLIWRNHFSSSSESSRSSSMAHCGNN